MSTHLHELGEVRLGVECCIFCGEFSLLVKRSANSKFFPNLLCFPGGHVDRGENIQEAAIRETFEETGITLLPEQLSLRLFTTNYHREKNLVWIITAFTAVLDKQILPVNSTEGVCNWYELSKLDKALVVPPVLEYFDHMTALEGVIKFSNGEYENGVLVTK